MEGELTIERRSIEKWEKRKVKQRRKERKNPKDKKRSSDNPTIN